MAAAGLASATLAAVLGGTIAGAASAAAKGPDVSQLQRQAIADRSADVAAPETRPKLNATIGAVVRVGNGRFAMATKDGRHAVVVRPQTTIWIDKRRASLDDINRGDAVLVLGRTGPRGNFVARTVRVLGSAS